MDIKITLNFDKIIKNIYKKKKHGKHFVCDYSYKHDAYMLWQTTF